MNIFHFKTFIKHHEIPSLHASWPLAIHFADMLYGRTEVQASQDRVQKYFSVFRDVKHITL